MIWIIVIRLKNNNRVNYVLLKKYLLCTAENFYSLVVLYYYATPASIYYAFYSHAIYNVEDLKTTVLIPLFCFLTFCFIS